jgi:enediyne biosynthesis protein E4
MSWTRRQFVRSAAGAAAGLCSAVAGEEWLRAETSAAGPIEFEDPGPRSGIDFILQNSQSPQRYSIETMLGGVAAFDYNNDGLLDLFFTNGAAIPSLEKSDPRFFNRLYRNNGDGTFADVTASAGVQGHGYSMGVAAGDYDNDGFVDVYVCGVNHNQLLHNNGDGTFTDVTLKAGIAGIHPRFGKQWSVTAGWFDYNNDGLLDLFVTNYIDYDLATAPACMLQGISAYCRPHDFRGTVNQLYRNNGDGTFTDVTDASGIGRHLGKGMGMAFADYDNDGFTDIFVSNDSFRNFLFHNNGNGTFTEVGMEMGAAYTADGGTVAGMGAEFRDLDNDGRPEIFQASMYSDTFVLRKNAGETFEDATHASRLGMLTRNLTAWGVGAYDFDNDGRKDLFTANAAILDNAMEIEHRQYRLPCSLFRNTGNLEFEDVSGTAGAGFLAKGAHRGAAFGDFNNDGRIDIAVTVIGGPPQLLINRTRNSNHWLTIALVGKRDNRDGLGAVVSIQTAHGRQVNHATTTVGYNSSSDKRVHFGLGDASIVDRIEIRWPSGQRQTLSQVAADRILTIVQETDGKDRHGDVKVKSR